MSQALTVDQAVVVKLGGEVVASPQMGPLAAGMKGLWATGAAVAVVHGAGPQLSALQKKLGIEVRQIAGRRYTDEATLEVVKMVVAGKVNVDLCTALRTHGLSPVGLHGAVHCRRRPPRVYPGAGDGPVDLGLVGDVTGFDLPLLQLLWQGRFVPVLACLGVGVEADAGGHFNINADTVASALARMLKARRLVLVSDRPVRRDRDDPGSLIPQLHAAEARALIEGGQAQGGMIAKLEEACTALGHGVKEVLITADLGPQTTVLRL